MVDCFPLLNLLYRSLYRYPDKFFPQRIGPGLGDAKRGIFPYKILSPNPQIPAETFLEDYIRYGY
jgi:hypothetical protein